MAKLSDLRSMLDEARARVRAETPKATRRANGSHKRALGAKKHADGDIDIGHAFADVTRLPATKNAGVARPQTNFAAYWRTGCGSGGAGCAPAAKAPRDNRPRTMAVRVRMMITP